MRYSDDEDAVSRERVGGIILLVVVGIFTVFDLVEDASEGATMGHTLIEAAVVVASFCGVVYLWRRVAKSWWRRTAVLQTALASAHADAERWRGETESFARGLSQAIDQQLKNWGLSPAEREISLLLLKGLSFKEMATIRQTSERTVRQQAAAIYDKSGLEGRAQLAAFFLEDILVLK